MKTITVEVKQKHIDRKGITREERNDVSDCMVAAALKDAGWTRIRCGAWTFNGRFMKKYFEDLSIPAPVTKKIMRWLTNKPVKPFSFQLKYDA